MSVCTTLIFAKLVSANSFLFHKYITSGDGDIGGGLICGNSIAGIASWGFTGKREGILYYPVKLFADFIAIQLTT